MNKVDEQEHNNRDIDFGIERQKAIKKNLVVNLLGINPAEEIFSLKLAKYKITLLNQLKN